MEQEQATDHTENLAQAIQDANSETEQSSTEQANFWNPVNFDEILQRFSKTESYNHRYARSFLYQPERISLNSHDAQTPIIPPGTAFGSQGIFKNTTLPQETFSQFNILFEKPLLRVKSIQLLSAIIPNPQPSIPDDECAFYYYRMRTLFNSAYTNTTGNPVWNSSATYVYGDVVVYQTAIPHTIPVLYFTMNYPPYLYAYTATDPGALSAIGTSFTISGAANSAWNGTFASQGTQGSDVGSWAVIALASQGLGNSSTATITYYTFTNYTYYVSKVYSNTNNTPDSSPNQWVQVGQSGGQTTAIYQPWNTNTTYSTGDVVFYTGTDGYTYFYTSVGSGNIGNIPSGTSAFWTQGSRSASTSPNWFEIRSGNVAFNRLLPSTVPPDVYPAVYATNATTAKNTTFPDYPTFVSALNATNQTTYTCQIPGDISFVYNQTLNKIQWVPLNQMAWVNGVFNNGYYYLYTGWNDPNYQTLATYALNQKYKYTLNLRAGFTWNGQFNLPADPWNGITGNILFATQIANYFTPFAGSNQQGGGTAYSIIASNPAKDRVTANSYADLVYTQSIRLYCDITQGSTQDSGGNAGLLSIIPMAATTLGVTFYQNNFNNPLTKIPEQLQSILIIMKTDSGDDYVLPSSASVSLELGIQYE